LLSALNQGWLAGAVLDVFQQEPLPQESPLWTHPNCTITPHVAAISLADDVAALFCENLIRYSQQKELLFLVNKEQGY